MFLNYRVSYKIGKKMYVKGQGKKEDPKRDG